VLRVFPDDAKVLVEHVMTVKSTCGQIWRNIKGRHRQAGTPVSLSNVALVCATCGQSAWDTRCAAIESAGLQEVRDDAGQIVGNCKCSRTVITPP
jgi:ribosomal protein L24